jgi:hypothetical protein
LLPEYAAEKEVNRSLAQRSPALRCELALLVG